jgi:undecaprenyl phosphate N,N'-diacetylbacillosamine 1-phosphate transferase
MYKICYKRLFDLIISALALIILSPIFLSLIVILHIVNNGSGVFFTQDRPGKNEVIFSVIKFKTMTDKKDVRGILLSDVNRLTKIGKFLRSTSLDELPQLINVLKGDMSLIGPRPLLVEYLPIYNKHQTRRHEVRPGITGWAQVNGRNAISWQEKFELDIYYINHLSFLLDMRIFFKTAVILFNRAGIYKDGDIVAMEAFNGKN